MQQRGETNGARDDRRHPNPESHLSIPSHHRVPAAFLSTPKQ
jgi:hypothetical protein